MDSIYDAWREWADLNGQVSTSKQVFGRDLRAARPSIKVTQPGRGDNRDRAYVGIGLIPVAST